MIKLRTYERSRYFMRLIKGILPTAIFKNGCVLTIGNFDGVHLGHKAVVEKLTQQGRRLNLPIVVLIFEPQPLEYFLGSHAPARLTRLREKVGQFAKLPVADLVVVRFNKLLADCQAEQFIERVLIKSLNVKYLVIGDDFRFGKNRLGNFALLQEKGKVYGFQVEDTGSLQVAGQRVSSTLIRTALAAGDLCQAEAMLGYSYSICGRVVHGNKRGRTIGYPTANVNLARKNSPVSGVFAVTVTGIDEQEIAGVANIGIRPTIDGSNKVVLETHLFDFNRDIYGQHVTVHFKHKIRSEQRFQTLDALKNQIMDDAAKAKQFFTAQK